MLVFGFGRYQIATTLVMHQWSCLSDTTFHPKPKTAVINIITFALVFK